MGVLRHGTIRNRLLMTLSYDVSAKIRGTKGECDLANGGNIKNNAPDHSDRLCDCRQPDAVSALIFMSYSSVMCILWILMESPDLAITEAAVGAGVSGILFLVTLKKIRREDSAEPGETEDDV